MQLALCWSQSAKSSEEIKRSSLDLLFAWGEFQRCRRRSTRLARTTVCEPTIDAKHREHHLVGSPGPKPYLLKIACPSALVMKRANSCARGGASLSTTIPYSASTFKLLGICTTCR